jgi:hypothetical protein
MAVLHVDFVELVADFLRRSGQTPLLCLLRIVNILHKIIFMEKSIL